jgi:hypothetical protein
MALSKITNASVADTAVHGRRNLIINGAMQVSQRGTSKTGVTSSGYYTVDRWHYYDSGSGAATLSQSTDAPDGFANSLKVDVTTADTPLTAQEDYRLRTIIEAQDLQMLNYGSSNAKSITISFWVKSTKTGTYTLNIYEADSVRIIGAEYTIDTANTWEKKSVTFAGDTGGGINNDNGASMYVQWVLGAGSAFYTGTFATSWQAYDGADYFSGNQVNVFDSTSNDFYLTGVQLEVGDTATPFEHRSYGEELALCQRYCHVWKSGQAYDPVCMMGTWSDNSSIYGTYSLPVEMRADPTVTYSGSFEVSAKGMSASGTTPTTNRIGKYVVQPRYNKASHGMGSGISGWLRDSNDSDATITFDAEL